VLPPGDDFDLDARIAYVQPCDSLQPDTLVLLAYPVGFPDSVRSDTTIYNCSSTPVVRFSAFSAGAEGGGVRLRWTLDDPTVTGFHVYRTVEGGPPSVFFPLTNPLLPASGGPDYAYLDGTVQPARFYRYYVAALVGITEFRSNILDITTPAAAFLELGSPHPNPTSAGTTWFISLNREARVNVVVRDLTGRRVKDIYRGVTLPAGLSGAAWDGTDGQRRTAPSGLYLIEVEADGERRSRRVALVR
jgi:hypothetical protein